MKPKIRFTEITDHQGEICKIISLNPDTGKMDKDGKATIWDGRAVRKQIPFADFPAYISSIPSDKAITLGISDYEDIPIVTSGKENPPDTIARSKKYFSFSPSNQLLFFDYDSRGDGHDISPNQFIDIISDIIPEFQDSAKVINYSASSFIFNQGKQINDGDGFHVYFVVEDADDIDRSRNTLFKRLWLKGYGYIGNSSTGSQLVRTVFDTMVFSPERLDFIAGAVCRDGLIQRKPDPAYVDGGVFDTHTLKDITDDEEDAFNQLVEDAKEENHPIAEKISGKYDQKATDEFIANGVSEHKAQAIIKSRKRQSLVDRDHVKFDDGTVLSVSELLDRGETFHGKTLYDPLEPDRGKCKAMFFWNDGKNPIINSFVHGERVFRFNRYDHSGNRNRGTVEGSEPTYPVEKFYTPHEASEELEYIIDGFLSTRKDTAVLYEAGGGKTRRTIQKIAEENKKRDERFNVAYFVNSHRIAEERIEDFENEIELPKIISRLDRSGRRDEAGKLKDDGGITIISGFREKCLLPNRKELVFDKERCDGCYYNAVERMCPYLNQYGIGRGKERYVLDRFRIYQHAHLFQPSSNDYGWKPDIIVVDEDVIGNMVQTLPLTAENNPIIRTILELYSENDNLQAVLKRKKGEIKKQIHLLFDRKKPSELTDWEMKFKKALNILLQHGIYDPLTKTDKPAGEVWVEGDQLYVGWLLEINEKWRNLPMLYLDASGNEEIISLCLGKDFDFHKVRCAYQDNVEVIQVENLSTSKYWILNNQNNVEKVVSLIDLFDNEDTGFISYKNIGTDDEGEPIPFISSLVPDENRCGWFGNLRGLNHFENLSTLMVIGRHKIGSDDIQRISRVIFRDGGLGLSSETIASEKTIRMKDGNHRSLYNWEYIDNRLQLLSDHIEKAETYQAIHRLRLVWGDKIKRLIYVSNQVVDITVDRVITFDNLMNGMLQLEDYIHDVGVWKYRDNKGLMAGIGITERVIRELKKKETDAFRVLKCDVREINSRKKSSMDFLISCEVIGHQEELSARIKRLGYELLGTVADT
jgi:hypothetical protein